MPTDTSPGRASGKITEKSVRTRLAPSMAACSSSSVGIASRKLRSMTMENGSAKDVYVKIMPGYVSRSRIQNRSLNHVNKHRYGMTNKMHGSICDESTTAKYR